MKYDPTDVTQLRVPHRGVIECEGRRAAFDTHVMGSVEAALSEVLDPALRDMDPEEDGYPVLRVRFGAASPIHVMAAAYLHRVGGVVCVVEPVWERLWHCPPQRDHIVDFIASACIVLDAAI